jgi:glycosyltransferase involved in cell wall biosynthesis
MDQAQTNPESIRESHVTRILLRKDDVAADTRITVIVSLYNYSRFITDCLDSVHAQTLTGLRLVVVDDASDDASADLVARWLATNGDRFGGYRLLQHVSNQGLARTRNTALAHTTTPLAFILDADNLLYPRCLERLLSALEHCDAAFAFCYAETFGEDRAVHNLYPWNPGRLARGNTIDAMVLLRRSVWELVGGYSTTMPVMGWEDFDLWFKIARAKHWGVLVPEFLTRYRIHGSSMLRTVTNTRTELLWDHLRGNYPEFFAE